MKRCSKCGNLFPATREHFNARKGSKDGLRGYCRQCHSRYAEDWAKAHPERARKNGLKAAANYRSRNRELVLKRTRQWKADNAEYVKDYMDRWHESNRTMELVNNHVSRALNVDLPADFTEDDWDFAVSYFEGKCAVCGRPLDGLFHTVSLDHWIPLSNPDCPGTIPSNIVPLCHGKDGCNYSKGGSEPEQWLVKKFGEKQGHNILNRIHEFFSLVRD